MSAWRRIALKLFPEHKRWIENGQETFSIYSLWFELLPMAREAHLSENKELLGRIYKFGDWCWKQKRSWYMQNAVAVAFYEHLVDHEETRRAIPQWLTSTQFRDFQDLFESRMSEADYEELLENFDAINKTQFASARKKRVQTTKKAG